MRLTAVKIIIITYLLTPAFHVVGQEFAGHLLWNPFAGGSRSAHNLRAAKTTATALTLPFFEDFTGYGASPDSNKWQDNEVYINNTMGASPISRGVATFDGLNSLGIPYDSFSNSTFRFADSLTSQPIDLSANTVADSIYLSFFYQPQGNGFYPLSDDSLMLYLKNQYGDFVLAWAVPGTTLRPFQQVMIPITDTLDFHNSFQFRFVNKAALYWADAIWNVDYIRMDKNRNMNDTAVTDVAFTCNQSFLLNDYTAMPYRQFFVSPGSEAASQLTDSIKNSTAAAQSITYATVTLDLGSGSVISAAGPTSGTISGASSVQVAEPFGVGTLPAYGGYSSVVFQTTYYFQTAGAVGPTANDTIVQNQVFDNYLAYDDGTAEKSYYLNLFPSLSGKIAIEYHLNRPDTMRGMAIYFGRQIPFATSKLFSIYVYSALAGVNGAPHDVIIDSTELLEPGYADSINHFWNYVFPHPLALPAGTFYAGTLQPLGGGSDSLYFGLDVNRIGSNHAYFNVLGNWQPSLISGAIMMRPIVGRGIFGTSVPVVNVRNGHWHVTPNPARDILTFTIDGDETAEYRITDIQGRTLATGQAQNGSSINICKLTPGMYFVAISRNGIADTPQKVIKL